MNNQGRSTLLNWIMIIATVLLFIVILQVSVLDNMNTLYNQSFETGLDTSGLDELQTFKKTASADVEGSEIVQTTEGFSLVEAWKTVRGTFRVILSFINGSFINHLIVNILGFPQIVATIFTILIWISLVLIVVALAMKVNP